MAACHCVSQNSRHEPQLGESGFVRAGRTAHVTRKGSADRRVEETPASSRTVHGSEDQSHAEIAQSQEADTDHSKESAIALLIRAAETDLGGPLATGQPSQARSEHRLRSAAALLGVPQQVAAYNELVDVVACALVALSRDDADTAVANWLLRSRPVESKFSTILVRVLSSPRSAYVPVLASLLSDPSTDRIWGPFYMSGALTATLRLRTVTGLRGRILQALRDVGSTEALHIIRAISTDRSRTDPSHRVLSQAKGSCPGGRVVDFEARALASERLIALGLLEDEVLLRQGRDDPTEPLFFRLWCSYMLQGRTPWLGTRDWKRRRELQIPAPCLRM